MNKYPIRTLIVEDEEKSLLTLRLFLQDYCPQVQLLATAATVQEGIKLTEQWQPDLIFLDITMPDGDGFELVEKTRHLHYEVIFTTAYDQFAVKAFEMAALHYLLKPINIAELQKALERYEQKHQLEERLDKIEIARAAIQEKLSRIALPSADGLRFVEINHILRIEADGSYAIFYMSDRSKITVSKPLNHYEKYLGSRHFFRIHDKHMVNLQNISHYVRGKGGYVVMCDGAQLDVSVRRKEAFLERISLV